MCIRDSQKEANYLFSGVDEILKKCTPNQRGVPDANGVPTISNIYAADATEEAKLAKAITADTALQDKQTQFQVRWKRCAKGLVCSPALATDDEFFRATQKPIPRTYQNRAYLAVPVRVFSVS